MPKSKVFMTKTERKELSKKIKSRPRQANGRFLPKQKPILALNESESVKHKVEMLKAVDDLDETPAWLYILFVFEILLIIVALLFQGLSECLK